MLHSIGWRLIASFTLLTVLTVTLLGVMVVTLMQRTLEGQANDTLNANAAAVAQQSQILFQPAPQTAELYQLAQTAAFLSDVQVRILDDEKQVLVDSGAPVVGKEMTWVMRGEPLPPLPGQPLPEFIVVGTAAEDAGSPPVDFTIPVAPPFAAASSARFSVRKLPGPWGDRLYFQAATVEEGLGATTTITLTAGEVAGAEARQWTVAEARARAYPPLQVMAPIQSGPNVVGYVELRSAPDLLATMLAAVRRTFLIAAALVSLVSVGVGLLISRGLTAPIHGLAAATERMNSGDLSARAPVHGNDEIGLLARQFNRMAEALESTFTALAAERDALRRFIADASHELRTPITALRTFQDLLLGNAAQDAAAQREFLLEGQVQIDRLERITGHLLNLSRLDGGLVELALADHDLGELVAAVAASLRPVAQERKIDLSCALPPQPTLVCCDRSQIETALINLLDNALKFTPAGGQVQVGVDSAGAQVKLWVHDNGPGIEADEASHLFDRFYRGRNATCVGSGLGLAIVQSIVHAHGGEVAVVSQPGVGSRFTITLNTPLTEAHY